MNPPYDFLDSFTKKHVAAGHAEEDAARIFDHFFGRGYVLKSPHHLIVFGDDPENPSDQCWYVAWAEYHPDYMPDHGPLAAIRHFLSLMPHHRPFIRWGRGLRGKDDRLFRTDRLLRLVRQPVLPS